MYSEAGLLTLSLYAVLPEALPDLPVNVGTRVMVELE